MKWLLVIVVVAGLWIWARSRQESRQPASRTHKPKESDVMQACRHCGVHMPLQEMVRGGLGVYCSEDHLRLAGDQRRHV